MIVDLVKSVAIPIDVDKRVPCHLDLIQTLAVVIHELCLLLGLQDLKLLLLLKEIVTVFVSHLQH